MTIDTSGVGIAPPPTPSKWDIIPIHTSDRATFKRCRRQWNWSSPSSHNLVPKASIYGVRMPLWFGTGIHYALERYYNPVLREDPVVNFETWFELEWSGGIVHQSQLSEFVDRSPIPYKKQPEHYIIKGLKEILPDPNYDLFLAHKEMGIGMMKFYKEYAQREDNFSVIMVEHGFSVPIIDPTTGRPMVWEDHRRMPDGYELNQYKEVHARGRQDVVVQDNYTGQYGIIDHKTAAQINEDYFRHLDLDDQVTQYAWSAEREAEMYDLEYKRIDFMIYNALRKAYPQPPTMLKSGKPSTDRSKESTTAQYFEKFIKDNGLQLVFEHDEKLQSYYSYLVEMGDKLFIQRDTVRRTPVELENFGRRLYYEAYDMLNNPALYHNPTKDYMCLNCAFRAPCKATEAGYDWEGMLADGYESNYDR